MASTSLSKGYEESGVGSTSLSEEYETSGVVAFGKSEVASTSLSEEYETSGWPLEKLGWPLQASERFLKKFGKPFSPNRLIDTPNSDKCE